MLGGRRSGVGRREGGRERRNRDRRGNRKMIEREIKAGELGGEERRKGEKE